jgi:hypothetical protein
MMENRFGLDDRYFKEKLGQLVRDASNYTPAEMSRALQGLKEVADSQALMFAAKHKPTASASEQRIRMRSYTKMG